MPTTGDAIVAGIALGAMAIFMLITPASRPFGFIMAAAVPILVFFLVRKAQGYERARRRYRSKRRKMMRAQREEKSESHAQSSDTG